MTTDIRTQILAYIGKNHDDKDKVLYLLESVRDALMQNLIEGMDFNIEDAIFDLKEQIEEENDLLREEKENLYRIAKNGGSSFVPRL